MLKTIQLIIGLIFVQMFSLLSGQIIEIETIDNSKISSWITNQTFEYQYVYHFGESEMESDFVLLVGNDTYYGQIRSGNWGNDGKSWIWTYRNLSNVRINSNMFYSDQTSGEFIIYEDEEKKFKGLKILNPWSGLAEEDEYEIGIKSYPIDEYYMGRFPQASKNRLIIEELNTMSIHDLKIMRNEIFARYGYKFKPGGEMDTYFKSQNWYSGYHDNVNNYLTDLEKENIKLIQQVEKK